MILRRSCLSFAAVLLASLSLARSGAAAEPRWVPFGPPAAPRSAQLVVEPGNGNRVYAFNETGLWLSRDDGDSWRSIQTGLGLPPRAVASDPFQPGRIFAVAAQPDYPGGLYRSDDFGAHWTPVLQNSPAVPQDLVADPFTKDTLFGLSGLHLYRSRDAGRTWSCVGVTVDCAQGFQARAFAVAPDRPKTLYIIGPFGADFYVSRDDGRTWTSSFAYLEFLDVLVATREPRVLYAWARDPFYRGDLTACFARSDDEGETWKGILNNTKCGAPAIDPGDPRTVRMVVVDNRVPQLWVSRNGGDTWSSAGPVPELGDVYVVPGGGLALATDKGLFRAPAEQGPWRPANRGFGAADVGAVLPVEGAVLAAPVVSVNSFVDPPPVSLLRTGDGGRSWEREPLTNPLALTTDPSDPLRLIASAMSFEGPWRFRILESRDGGHTWRGVVDPQAPRPYNATALAIDPFLPQTFYSNGPSGGVYRSDDGGLTWRESNLGLRRRCYRYGCSWGRVHTILTDPTKAGRMFIHINDSMYRSLDYGISWTQLRTHQGPSIEAVYELARDLGGALIMIGGGPRAGDSFSLGVAYRSTDHGATWERLGRLPVAQRFGNSLELEVSGLAATEGALWVSSRTQGIFRSTDGGGTWRSANAGLPLPSVTSLATDPEDPARLFVTVQGNGIYTLAAP